MRRMKRKVKLDKKQIVTFTPEHKLNSLSFWREVLIAVKDRKGPHAKFKILVDSRAVAMVEESLTATLNKGYEMVENEVFATMTQELGKTRRHRFWQLLTPRWYDLMRHLGPLMRDLESETIRNFRRFWNGPMLPARPDGVYVRVGAVTHEHIHCGGYAKVLVLPVKIAEHPWKAGEIVQVTGDNTLGWWSGPLFGQFRYFLNKTATDEDLIMLYQEFPSCHEIQTELVSRSRDFHVPENLKPVIKFSKIGKIGNAELRRTLMTIGNVTGYPEAEAVDDEGELFLLDRHTKVLKITCPSTDRVYHLGVPATMETPREARRWTLGLPEGAEIIAET